MSGEDGFKPRLGRLGDQGRSGGKRFRQRLLQAGAKLNRAARKPAFTGARFGRGTAAGRMASWHGQSLARMRVRRVVVKVHIARSGKAGGKALFRAHLKYLQRDGVDRDGKGGELYSKDRENVGDRDFVDRSEKDRHQFRIIVAPEDGDALGDLKENTRALMAQMEKDLGTRLDWVAVDHHNTGHPHTHVVIRGKDQTGKDLVIAREYLTKGLRRQAEDLATLTLGPRRDVEILQAQKREVGQDRYTAIDQGLEADAVEGLIEIGAAETSGDRFKRSMRLSRLKHLEGLRLAEKLDASTWKLSPKLGETLQAMGRKNDIIRTLSAEHTQDRGADVHFFAGRPADAPPLLGEVLSSGPEDELRDRRFLLVRSFKGDVWHVDASGIEPGSMPPDGAVVEVTRAEAKPLAADRTILEVAERSGGVYSDALHKLADPGSSEAYRLAHKRRLEALRRGGVVERMQDGAWQVPADYLERAVEFEGAKGRGVRVGVKSWLGLEALVERAADTWLEGKEAREPKIAASQRLRDLQTKRRQFLMRDGWLGDSNEHLSEASRKALQLAEMRDAAASIGKKLGAQFQKLDAVGSFEGQLIGTTDLAAGRFGIVSDGKQFALVPWRAEMGRHLHRSLVVRRTADRVSWQLAAHRSKELGI
jgi:type IV secretory pathway VirD2 relaxase